MAEDLKVRFVIDPKELEELGLDPRTLLGGGGPKTDETTGPSPVASKPGGGGTLKGAAIVGALVGGVMGLLDFFKQLLQNSQILNTYAGAFGKVFSAALDILLTPFIPVLNLLLAGMLKLLAWLIDSGYLEKMSQIVDQYIVPALQLMGAGLDRLWDAMNHSLNPMNWDWGKLGKLAAADLLGNAAMIMAAIEGVIDAFFSLPGLDKLGVNLDPFRDGSTGPMAMFNTARGMVGQDPVSQKQFRNDFDLWLAAVGVGAVGGAAVPLPGIGSGTGAAVGGLSAMGGLLYQPSDQKAMGAAGAPQGQGQGDVTVNATFNVTGNTPEQMRAAAADQNKVDTRRGLSQVLSQP